MKRDFPWSLRMTVLAILLTLAAPLGHGEAQQGQPSSVVDKLYGEVVRRHPLGVPSGADQAAIWPLLSKRLIKVFETRNACDADWERQHPDANTPPYILKPPGFYEDGLFSGQDERGYLDGAAVGTTKAQADGSYLVYVNVWSYYDGGDPSLRTTKVYRWKVAARVIGCRSKAEIRTIDSLLAEVGSAYHEALGLPKDVGSWARADAYQIPSRLRR